jgi:hypothetical protein
MQVVVRIVDHSDFQDASKRGDVIAIFSEDHVFSDEELNATYWRTVSAPILMTHVDALLSRSPIDDVVQNPRFRDWMIDFSKMPDPSLFIYDGNLTNGNVGVITVTREQLEAATVQKP